MINKKIKILLYSSNIWYFGEGLLGPLFAVFGEKIGGNILDITWAWAIYLIVSGACIILIGKISDSKINKEKTMILGYALNAAGTLGYIFVDTQFGFFLVQTILGVAAALAIPTWNALYAKCGDTHNDGYEWGLANGQSKIMLGLAALLGGLVVSYFSFTVLFLIMGVIQVIATVYQMKILKQ